MEIILERKFEVISQKVLNAKQRSLNFVEKKARVAIETFEQRIECRKAVS